MNQHIHSLTSTRGFAALLVFIFHYGTDVFPFNKVTWLFTNGNLAVSYFFVLSGFILYLTYREQNMGYWHFLKKRIARIYPAYLLALVLQIVIIRRDIANDANALKEISSSVLLAQAYFPSYVLSLNSPGWSICCEMLFYASFPLLLILEKRRRTFFLIITSTIYFLTQLMLIQFSHFSTVSRNLLHYNPVMHINEFLIGMAGGLLFDYSHNLKRGVMVSAIILICILGFIYCKPDGLDASVGLIAPLFMLLIVTVSNTTTRLLNLKPFVYLGEISYGVYIFQSPIRELMHQFNNEYNFFTDNTFFHFSLAVLILFAALSYRFVEKPLRQWIASEKIEPALQP